MYNHITTEYNICLAVFFKYLPRILFDTIEISLWKFFLSCIDCIRRNIETTILTIMLPSLQITIILSRSTTHLKHRFLFCPVHLKIFFQKADFIKIFKLLQEKRCRKIRKPIEKSDMLVVFPTLKKRT